METRTTFEPPSNATTGVTQRPFIDIGEIVTGRADAVIEVELDKLSPVGRRNAIRRMHIVYAACSKQFRTACHRRRLQRQGRRPRTPKATVARLAAALSVPERSLRRWLLIHQREGVLGLVSENRGRPRGARCAGRTASYSHTADAVAEIVTSMLASNEARSVKAAFDLVKAANPLILKWPALRTIEDRVRRLRDCRSYLAMPTVSRN